MSDKLYVRLKPYNAQQGILVRRYIIGRFAFTTDPSTERPIWNIIDRKEVERMGLANLKQVESESRSLPLFDILTPEEYAGVEKREQDLRLVELGLISATNSVPTDPTPIVDRTKKLGGRDAAIPEPEIPADPVILDPQPVSISIPVPTDAITMDSSRNDSDVNYAPPLETPQEPPLPSGRRRRGRPSKQRD